MSSEAVELVIVPGPGAVPIRRTLSKVVTTIGADPSADLCLTTVERQWAVVKREGAQLQIRVLATGATLELALGDRIEIDGVVLERPIAIADTIPDRLPVDRLAAALADAEAPDDALAALLRSLLELLDAEGGAFVLRERDGYVVPLAEQRDGSPMADGADLLSDTLVRDVLESGEPVCLGDALAHQRYGHVPSVASLQLSSALCVPMRLGGKTMGALFLGKRGAAAFQEHHVADLETVGSMVLPLLAQLRRTSGRGEGEYLLVGEHDSMAEVRRLVQRIGPSTLSVLILGDTGTGKEMVARALHHASDRGGQAMVALNCSAVPESLLGAELFGAKKGAYTGAIADRKGVVERADGSTLFLDEVGDMPPPMQAALLRVLEERQVTRLGDGESRAVDFRLVAATHKDLEEEVEAGRFRRDLLFRLKEVTIALPSLAQRGDDVLLLASLFLRKAERELGLLHHRFSPAAEKALLRHSWPGNVRELKATMRRAALLCDGDAITPDDLQLAPVKPSSPPPAMELPLAEARERFVADYVSKSLDAHDGNREAAAAALGISLRTLYRYLGPS